MTSAILTSSAVLPAAGLLTSPATLRNIDADVREFWSTFPCPPPWRPRLLIEVNSTRLDPSVSRTVQSFLAGKCEIKHILFPSDMKVDTVNDHRGTNPRLTDTLDHGSSLSDLTEARHPWCDTPCQLSIGCALFFVVVVMMVAVLVCVTKHRVRHKMAAARPSRQQLQLSTSTSDAVNCADFTNLEVQGDDDVIYPPFRHRGLPIPPRPCHPSCDPKWNCPSCALRHPLMRMSPSSQCYSRAYSAVYETIDDDDDDDDIRRPDAASPSKPRVRTPSKSNSRESCHSCSPCQTSPTSISTVQIRSRAAFDEARGHQMAETGFNGEEGQDRFGIAFLSNYFELEHNCALKDVAGSDTVRETGGRLQLVQRDTTGECNGLYPRDDQGQGQIFQYSPQYPAHPSCQTFLPVQHNSSFASNDLLTSRPQQTGVAPPSWVLQEAHTLEELRPPMTAHTHSRTLNSDSTFCSTFVPPRHYLSSPPGHTAGNNTKISLHHPQGNTVCPMATFEPIHLPTSYYCNSCRQDSSLDLQGFLPRQRSLPCGVKGDMVIGPDLLKEASNQIKQDLTKPTKSTDHGDENNEVPLRKPVLALHSQYFAKTSAA
ncbi:hypothetical protein Btru_002680 [Bulinus truncatus]|nr:hypothetical protein Btru_002680 [Bulinus truncatus]